jgi:hypothetical protein
MIHLFFEMLLNYDYVSWRELGAFPIAPFLRLFPVMFS